jgi:hypothetical protein
VAQPPACGDGDIYLAGGQIVRHILRNSNDVHEDAGGRNAQSLDQWGDDDLDRVIGRSNPKGTF